MSDVTRILSQIESGDPAAAEQLLPLVYDELRNLASARLALEKPGQTLQATALVHEAYLRLVDSSGSVNWNSRGHFFGAAAEAMRRILIDHARRKGRIRHGGGRTRLNLDEFEIAGEAGPDNLLDLDAALTRLSIEEAEAVEVVKLRYFAGLTIEQCAQALGISVRTANRHWAFAKAWLYQELNRGD